MRDIPPNKVDIFSFYTIHISTMGIKGFFQDLRKHFGYKGSTISLEELRGKRLAVDVSHLMYKAKYALHAGNRSPIIRYFARFIVRMYEINTYMVMVFDGIPPALKGGENNRRREIQKKLLNEIATLKDKRDDLDPLSTDGPLYEKRIAKLEKRANHRPTKEEVRDLQELFDALTIPYIVTDGHDAENLCAYLNHKGLVDYVISGDSDVFAFGGKNIIKGYKNCTDIFDCDYIGAIMNAFSFTTIDQLIHYAILVGNDYNDRKKGNGPKTSQGLILSAKDSGSGLCSLMYGHYATIVAEYTLDFESVMPEFKTEFWYLYNKSVTNEALINASKQSADIASILDIVDESDTYTIKVVSELFQ